LPLHLFIDEIGSPAFRHWLMEPERDERSNRLQTTIRTLVFGGFILEGIERNPGFVLIRMDRFDEFGAQHRYAFVLEERTLSEAEVGAARIAAEHHHAQLVLVGDTQADEPGVPWNRFVSLFGGAVVSASALDPGFGSALQELGMNRLPDGLVGTPDELFEAYVRAGFEFVFAGRVVRYGQDRRFEKRPDGIALPHDRFRALYDAKAYSNGYPVTADSIRQFKSYIEEFDERYHAYIPRQSAFIVVSGSFEQRDEALRERSTELLAECGVPLSFLTARTMAEIIALVSAEPATRHAISWTRIFSRPIVETARVQEEIAAIRKDAIVRGA
jgi:hypothetical protein